jgi:hypothetical protein
MTLATYQNFEEIDECDRPHPKPSRRAAKPDRVIRRVRRSFAR